MSNQETAPIDFETLGKVWAYIVYLKSRGQTKKVKKFQKSGRFPDDLMIELNWKNANLEFCDLGIIESPNSQMPTEVFHVGEFHNSKSKFEHTISHKEKTEAVFDVTVVEGKTTGLGVEPQLPQLPEDFGSMTRSPFGKFFPLSIDARQIPGSRHEQTWTCNGKLELGKDENAIVEIVVEKSQRQGEFRCTARLSGKLSAQISKKKGGEPTLIDAEDFPAIYHLFTRSVISVNSVNQLRVNKAQRSLDWSVSGNFNFIYGLGYKVTTN